MPKFIMFVVFTLPNLLPAWKFKKNNLIIKNKMDIHISKCWLLLFRYCTISGNHFFYDMFKLIVNIFFYFRLKGVKESCLIRLPKVVLIFMHPFSANLFKYAHDPPTASMICIWKLNVLLKDVLLSIYSIYE